MAVIRDREKARQRAASLVEQMTLAEKVSQIVHKAPAIKRLGIPSYNWWGEGLHGVARAGTATVFPQAIGLAASFDEALLKQVGEVISTEARAKFHSQQKYGDTDIYKGLTLWSPNVNIFRDPRWGRGHETYGEDPFLSSWLAVSYIEGMQGEDPDYLKVACCAKHYAVHSGPEDIRHQFNAEVSEKDLRETYLPAFEACVREGQVEGVMGAYNRVNGDAACANPYLISDVLRGEWAFAGYFVSDCWAIRDLFGGHGLCETPTEAAALAINEGCDLNCGDCYGHAYDAVIEGKLAETKLDESLIRLFTTRILLGLFDEGVGYAGTPYSENDSPEHQLFNREVAQKVPVLLKNEGILPLDLRGLQSIGVIGPNADNRKALIGNYEGTASEYWTVLDGVQAYAREAGVRVYYSEGCHLYKDRLSGLAEPNDRLSEVKAVCEQSDVVLAVFGLDSGLEGEEGDKGNQFASGDKKDILLPGIQREVLEAIYASGKPVVLVNLSGSALALDRDAGGASEGAAAASGVAAGAASGAATVAASGVASAGAMAVAASAGAAAAGKVAGAAAILQGWYPGAQGGLAIADLLFGKVSPQGKLPLSFYSERYELPAFTDYSMKNRTYRFVETAEDVLYPFGYGLTYSRFSLAASVVDAAGDVALGFVAADDEPAADGAVANGAAADGAAAEGAGADGAVTDVARVSLAIQVANEGDFEATETVQVYVKATTASGMNPQLKAVKKCPLKPGESASFTLTLGREAFEVYDSKGQKIVPEGAFDVYVGFGQPDQRTAALYGQEAVHLQVSYQ